jgi:hypothetical protein
MCTRPIAAQERLGRHVPAATNISNNRIVGRVVFYTVRVVSKNSPWFCVSPLLVHVPPKQWPEDSGSLPWNSEPTITVLARTSSNLLNWTMYFLIVFRQRLGIHVPAATNNCWRRRFLCGPVGIKGKKPISSYKNFSLFDLMTLPVAQVFDGIEM